MYVKIFDSLWQGSLYGQTDAQLVFIFLLAHCDADGHVRIVPEAIAGPTGLSIDRVRDALAMLEGPDAESGSPEQEGRRLEPIGEAGGRWQIVNYLKYRGMRDEEERRRQNREAKRRQRLSAKVSQGQPSSAQEEAEAEEEAVKHPCSKPRREPDGFDAWYSLYPRHVARRAAARAYAQALTRTDYNTLVEGVRRYRETLNGTEPSKIKHPATWLNGDCWLDEAEAPLERPKEPDDHSWIPPSLRGSGEA